jgi:predicted transposase/invertase (TIGR01784 family)
MSIRVLPPTNDWIFKLLFGDERNKSVLIDMLKSFVDLPDEEYELTFMDTHLKLESMDDKLGILDVKVRTKSGKVIDIEIQVDPMKHIGSRLSFYKSKLIAEQIAGGDDYRVVQRVICVCITSYELFPGVSEYVNRFRFHNPKNGLCFEAIPEEIFTIELPKVPSSNDGNRIWEWLQFLLARTKEEIEMMAERNPEIRKAANALYVISADPELRARYEAQEKARMDRQTLMLDALEDAVENERNIWQGVVANKDSENERLRLENERLMAQIAGLQAKPGS